jgi:hypothetical protein
MKERMKLSLPPKLVGKVIEVPVISFCKISFPVKHLMPNYAETGCFNLSYAFDAQLCRNWLFQSQLCI